MFRWVQSAFRALVYKTECVRLRNELGDARAQRDYLFKQLQASEQRNQNKRRSGDAQQHNTPQKKARTQSKSTTGSQPEQEEGEEEEEEQEEQEDSESSSASDNDTTEDDGYTSSSSSFSDESGGTCKGESEEENKWDVEDVKAVKLKHSKKLYWVKWKGYPNEHK